MSLFNRIAIGTANWGKKYRGVQISQEDKKHILRVAREWGINTIDTAVAYENDVYDMVGSSEFGDKRWWRIIDKVKTTQDKVGSFPYAILGHGFQDGEMSGWLDEMKESGVCKKTGWSVYSVDPKPTGDIIQIPYNPYDWHSINYIEHLHKENMEVHVRSVFLAGRALKDFTAQQCISFALMNPKIDKIVVGFDTYEQFEEDIGWIVRIDSKKSYRPDIYDTRRF